MSEIRVTRKPYTRKDGTQVKGTTYFVTDKGKPGKTPESEKWYEHGVKMGWHKDLPARERREKALQAHKGDKLATARALQALANVTTDPATARAAKADADHFFKQQDSPNQSHRRGG